MNGRTHYRGTVLVVALGLLAALAIIGATMISVARIDRFASRSFRQSAELDMAVDGSLVWIETDLTNQYWNDIYWSKITGGTVNFDGDGVVDGPAKNSTKTRIAVARPNEQGQLVSTTVLNMPGVYCGSGNPASWYNLPVKQNLPAPGKSDTSGKLVPDGWVIPDLKFRTTRNRTIEISLTVRDLGGCYNVNFHGDGTVEGGNWGQSYNDEGFYLSDVAPNYGLYSESSPRMAMAKDESQRQRQWVSVITGSGASTGRWGLGTQPASKNPDKTMNFFNPDKDKPYLADDQIELMDWRGVPRLSRLERAMPRTFARDGSESGGSQVGSVDPMFFRPLYTCYSWASSCRPRISNDSRDKVVPKVDLDSCTKEEIREALLACGFRDTKEEMMLMDQVLANILDYRDKDGRPTAVKGTAKSGGSYTVYGVDRQPFISEYYIRKERADRDSTVIPFTVFVELSNPYPERKVNDYESTEDKGLHRGDSYTHITVGKGSNATTISLPEWIAPAPDDRKPPVKIEVVSKLIEIPRDATEPMDYLEPVLLFAKTQGDEEKDIVIDRLTLKKAAGGYEEISTAESWQRPNRAGYSRTGDEAKFFAGWVTDYEKKSQTCSGGDDLFNATKTTGKMRPIENRSITKDEWVRKDNRERAIHKGEELSFPRVGDVCRVLRIGHAAGTKADFSDYVPVTEAITKISKDEDGYVSPIGSTSSTSTAGRRSKLLQRIFDVITVNSPYFDGVDNDGDYDDKNGNNVVDNGEPVFDDKDTGFQKSSGNAYPIDILGPEIYEQARINLKTAPPEVIRGMLPLQLQRRGKGPWDVAMVLSTKSMAYDHPGDMLREAACVEGIYEIAGKSVFIQSGPPHRPRPDEWDDDDNGAVDDFAEQCYLYTYMSNWATVRSDCYAVYGTARITSESGRIEGVRRFVAVLDRVPATAYPPFRFTGQENPTFNSSTNFDTLAMTPNPKFIPVRRVMQSWIE